MIIIALLLFVVSLALFLAAETCIWLALPGFSAILFKLGALILLSVFALLLITGLLLACKTIFQAVSRYFLFSRRVKRRLLFAQGKQDQTRRLFYYRKMYIQHFHELKRNQLLKANNRKHIHSLSRAIHKELQVKKGLSPALISQLQQENALYRQQEDIKGLISLQLKIAAIV